VVQALQQTVLTLYLAQSLQQVVAKAVGRIMARLHRVVVVVVVLLQMLLQVEQVDKVMLAVMDFQIILPLLRAVEVAVQVRQELRVGQMVVLEALEQQTQSVELL